MATNHLKTDVEATLETKYCTLNVPQWTIPDNCVII